MVRPSPRAAAIAAGDACAAQPDLTDVVIGKRAQGPGSTIRTSKPGPGSPELTRLTARLVAGESGPVRVHRRRPRGGAGCHG